MHCLTFVGDLEDTGCNIKNKVNRLSYIQNIHLLNTNKTHPSLDIQEANEERTEIYSYNCKLSKLLYMHIWHLSWSGVSSEVSYPFFPSRLFICVSRDSRILLGAWTINHAHMSKRKNLCIINPQQNANNKTTNQNPSPKPSSRHSKLCAAPTGRNVSALLSADFKQKFLIIFRTEVPSWTHVIGVEWQPHPKLCFVFKSNE